MQEQLGRDVTVYNKMSQNKNLTNKRKDRHEPVVENRDFKQRNNGGSRPGRRNLGRNLTRKVGGIVLAASLTGLGFLAKEISDEVYLNPNDFQNAKWEQVYNKDGVIWDDYVKSGIPKNSLNWTAYQMEVKERNSGKLTGYISVPVFNHYR